MDSVGKRPLVSVGIPVFNEEKRISARLQNLESQRYSNLQFCISDNGSTDGTVDRIFEFMKTHRNVKLHRFERNVGALPNFAKTVDMADGEYFVWAAADDEWHPDFITQLTESLERFPGCQISMSRSTIRRVDGHSRDVISSDGIHKEDKTSIYQLLRRLLTADSSVKSVGKFNLFFYGVYRTATLRAALIHNPNILLYGDRVLPSIVIASGGGRCVDRALFTKNVNPISYSRRAPEDELTTRKRSYYFYPLETFSLFLRTPTVTFRGLFFASLTLLEVVLRRERTRLVSTLSAWRVGSH